MKKTTFITLGALILMIGFCSADAFADQEWVRDILERKDRYWNTTVTVQGQVMSVEADPPGTARGTYQLQDESTDDTLTIRTDDLPPVGKTFSITGMILQDPDTSEPYMRETSRTSAGFPPTMRIILIGGGALFLILLIIFIVLLLKPKKAAQAKSTVRPTSRPETPSSSPEKTTKMPRSAPPPAEADKTQVFVSLGAEVTVEKGPDQGKDYTLHKQVMTIGRPGARKNDIELNDDTVSKQQASIYYDNTKKQFTIKNESTTNPTMVDKNVVTESAALENGSQIEMGKTVLKFKME